MISQGGEENTSANKGRRRGPEQHNLLTINKTISRPEGQLNDTLPATIGLLQ